MNIGAALAHPVEMALSDALPAHPGALLLAGTDASRTLAAAWTLAQTTLAADRVTLVDAWGELHWPDGFEMASDDDHGVSDMVLFGISPKRLAHRHVERPTLQLIKSGSDSVAQEQILASPRWHLLLDHAAASGERLVIVACAHQPGVSSLAQRCSSVVLVDPTGDSLLRDHGDVVTFVPGPAAPVRPAATDAPAGEYGAGNPTAETAARPPWDLVPRWPVALPLLITLAGLAALFLAPLLRSQAERSSTSFGITSGAQTDSTIARVPVPIQPLRDSVRALRYSVEIAVMNTRAGAYMRLAELNGIRGSTVTPVQSADGTTWYRVFAGAFGSRSAADSLQRELRERQIHMAEGDRVVSVPLALRLAMHFPGAESEAEADLLRYISLGLPAYLVPQEDGALAIFAGAFESAEQALHLSDLCATTGVTPRLALRTGRQ